MAICQLEGRECIMVTSGAVAFGKQKLEQELLMSLSMRETLSPKDHTQGSHIEPRAAAAIGQSGKNCVILKKNISPIYFPRINVVI